MLGFPYGFQLSHPYMMMGKTIHSTIWTFAGIEFIITEFTILQSRGYEDVVPNPFPTTMTAACAMNSFAFPCFCQFPKDLSGLWSYLPGIAHT